jgi:hypothetical protein
MKKIETEADDELLPEYDLKKLRVRKVGPERRRREILKNAKVGVEEMDRGELRSFSNVDDLVDSLNHD